METVIYTEEDGSRLWVSQRDPNNGKPFNLIVIDEYGEGDKAIAVTDDELPNVLRDLCAAFGYEIAPTGSIH